MTEEAPQELISRRNGHSPISWLFLGSSRLSAGRFDLLESHMQRWQPHEPARTPGTRWFNLLKTYATTRRWLAVYSIYYPDENKQKGNKSFDNAGIFSGEKRSGRTKNRYYR
jgi:hypothetical protein